MANEPRVAVDTCVFVNIITNGARDDASWLKFSRRVVNRALEGKYRLVVPTLVIAEVAGNGKIRGDHLSRNERSVQVAAFREWLDKARFLEVELDSHTARLAADLAIANQLKGGDAAVLACALTAKADVLYTWDDGLLKLRDTAGISIAKPSILDDENLTDTIDTMEEAEASVAH
jgi:predicted nucleic acid-binding protein